MKRSKEDRKMNKDYKRRLLRKLKVFTALFVVSAMLIQFFGNNYLLAYSQDNVIATYDIGVDKETVTATLTSDGMLTLSGSGDTKDYTAETMPFTDNVDKISTLVIEDGITSIGDYLFFGCRNLNDKLEIPKTIVHIGDYAFNGYSKETAPAFTYITNDFKSADITVPVESKEEQPETEKSVPQETKDKAQEPQSTEAETNNQNVNKSDPVKTEDEQTKTESNTSEQPVDDATMDNNTGDTVTMPEEKTPQSSGKIEIKTITEQEIGTDIFFPNQTGGYKAEKTNKSFRTAVESAGYIEADRFVTVKLDNVITQHLPVKDGKLIIPDRPNYGIEPTEPDDAYTTHTFRGWSIDNQTLQPKDTYAIADHLDEITLTSEWNTEWSIQPQVKTEAKEEVTVYSVIDKNTQKEIEKAEGYVLSVQWQMNSKDKEDGSLWEDIKDASSSTYERKVQSGDTSSFFRAKVTIIKESKLRTVSEPKTLTTDPVNGINSLTPITVIYDANGGTGLMDSQMFGENEKFKPDENAFTAPIDKVFVGWKVTEINNVVAAYPSETKNLSVGEIIKPNTVEFSLTLTNSSASGDIKFEAQWSSTTMVYVDQSKGNDSNDGSESKPVKSLSAAYNLLPENGQAETNIIVLKANYSTSNNLFENTKNRNITFKSNGTNVYRMTINGIRLYNGGDTIYDNVEIYCPRYLHICTNWYNLILTKNCYTNVAEKSSSGIGVPTGKYDALEIYPTISETRPSTSAGPRGDSEDNPITIKLESDNTSISRIGSDSRVPLDGNTSSESAPTYTHLELKSGNYGVVAAGSVYDGESWSRATINIYDGASIYAIIGGQHSNTTDGKYHGVMNVNMYGGEIETLYGGQLGRVISTSGYSEITANMNIYNGHIQTIYCAGATGTLKGQINLKIYGGFIDTIYGGGYGYSPFVQTYYNNSACMYGDLNIEILGGEISGDIYLGGKGYQKNNEVGSAQITGNLFLHIGENAVINGDVYGGGEGITGDSTAALINGNVNINIDGGSIIGNIYGGGNQSNVNGKTTITINKNDIRGTVYGGGNIKGTIKESQVNIEGIVTNSIYAGGKGSGTTVTTTNLNIEKGANVKGNTFGGSEQGAVTNSVVNLKGGYAKYVFGGSDQASVTGSVSINSLAGSTAGNIYAGCNASGSVKNPTLNLAGKATNVFAGGNATDKAVDDVNGTSTININTDESNKITNVYGGANTTGKVTSSIINISGNVENVYGGGLGVDTNTYTPTVNILAGANVTNNVYGGGEEGITHGTTVDIKGGTVNNAFAGGHMAGADGIIKITSFNGSKIVNLYGGANSKGDVTSSVVNVSGDVENVYGGGLGADTNTYTPTVNILAGANVTGSVYGGGEEGITHGTTVDIQAGTVNNAFAGGHMAGADGTVKITSHNGSKTVNLYGGANESGTVSSPIISISGEVKNAFGGGYGNGTTTTSPTVNIESGANITDSAFGGGNLGEVSDPTVNIKGGSANKVFVGGNKIGVTGNAVLNASNTGSGKISNIYGGANSSGTVNSPQLNISGNAENIYGGGYGGAANDGSGTVTTNPIIKVTSGTITNIYGGGEMGPTSGTNKIDITGGTVTNIYGGGKSIGTQNTDITVSGDSASITNVFGGSSLKGDVVNSNIKINGKVDSIYGGGEGASTKVTETYVITGTGSKAKDIYGGSKEGTVKNTTLVIHDPVTGSVYGGGYGSTSVVKGDTWVYTANNVAGNIYGGGNQGSVNGNTHVDVAAGTIGTAGDDATGNVFGGSNQAKVNGDTKVHIGSYVVVTPSGATLPTTTDKKITILGTVFGGGNTTSTGKDFDASDPYVMGTATVEIGGTDYTLDIKKSIFGDGNKCVTNGDKTINIKDYTALKENANTSIQRATTLVIENSDIELIGEKDTANLVTTIDYSLNRIDKLVLKDGTLLKLQSPVNLVMGLESKNADDSLQTSAQANSNTKGNRLYIQQGQHVDLRINEDVSRPGYGDVKGFTQLGRYYIDGTSIDADAQGVYIMGSYYTDPDSNTNSGFIVADAESFTGQSVLNKGDVIEATTNSSSWRNWLLGSSVKNATKNMIVSDEPGDGKTAMVTETWAADGSIYRIDPDSVEISGNGKYTIVNPNDITASSPENTIGLSIETGQTGWLEQLKAGYIDSRTKKIIPYKTGITDTASVGDSLDMRSIVNDKQTPVINVKLYNSENITTNDAVPLVVSFTVDRISEQTDGSEVKTGSIIVTMSITQKTTTSFTNVLISQGKTYDRGEQSYNYDTSSGAEATSVSKNSSVTAQFAEKSETARNVTSYKLNTKSGQTLSDSSLPAGTKILMIDKSETIPKYYNYTVTSPDANISLTEFTKNGKSEKYTLPAGSIKKSNFIFIFDFMDTSSDKDLLVTLVSEYSGGASSEKKLRFKATGNDRTYKISSQQDNSSASSVPSYRMNGMFGITLNTTANADADAGTDTTGSDLQMAAKVQLKLTNTDTGTVLPIPKGWQIQSNGTRYSTSGDSATIILANSLTATNSDIFVIMSNMGDIPAGSYKLEISLVAGAMANYPSSTLDTKTIIYRFKLTDDRYSIKATVRDEAKQVIAQADTDKTISYDVIRVSNGSSSTSNIETKLTLWKKKDDGTYAEVTFADTVEKLSDITTGREIPITDQIIPWATYKTISITLKDTAAVGTYQLRYEIVEKSKANSVLASEVSSFIVTKD